MCSPATSAPVCVTGAAGFVASRVIEQLLARGHQVRGTVRNVSKTKDLAHIRALPGAGERLSLVRPICARRDRLMPRSPAANS